MAEEHLFCNITKKVLLLKLGTGSYYQYGHTTNNLFGQDFIICIKMDDMKVW